MPGTSAPSWAPSLPPRPCSCLAVGVAVRGSAHCDRARRNGNVVVRVRIDRRGGDFAVSRARELVRRSARYSESIVQRARRAPQGIAYDARLRTEVVGDLQSKGVDAVPGFAGERSSTDPAVANAIRERGASASLERRQRHGRGMQRRDRLSPSFARTNSDSTIHRASSAGPIDIAVIGESLALGHCVAPSTSAVDRVRARFPRTANFGVAASRVLSQLGVFREYVEPLEPAVVVWFVKS